MDKLDRYQEAQALHCGSPHATLASEATRPLTDMPETDYPVTIIGCIRGVDGWYLAGYDKRTKTIKPLEQI